MAQPPGPEFLKNVLLLKNSDFVVINDQVPMPTKSEIATIRARTEQYKKGVAFNASMSSHEVKKKLEETFPYLKDKGFFCAAKRNLDNDASCFDFDGSPRQWNGKTIKDKIQGNSALFILETDQIDTSSGIATSDSESSQVAEMLLPWLRDNFHFEVECNPNYSPLQGEGPCVFSFSPGLHSEVTSVFAKFEELGTSRKLEHTSFGWLCLFPASSIPRVVMVTLTSQDCITLGKTQVTYGTNLQQVVSYQSHLKKFFEDFMSGNPSGNPSGNSGGETERFRTLGCKNPAHMLSLLVYVAAEIGAQQFIEIIFTSSAKRVVHNAYKRNLKLPETIARDHGYIETANYLADVTKRFSEETTTDNECSQTINWSEFVKAAGAAGKQIDLTNEKLNGQVEANDQKETGYLADVDTSSSEASAPQSSDSENDISNKTETTAKTTTTERLKGWVSGRECQIGLQKDLHGEDHNADTGDPIAGNYRGCKETLHLFGSSFGDSSSDVSSQISDERPGNIGRRRPVVKKSYSSINLINNSGLVAVGRKRAIIKGAPVNHPTGEENLDQPITSAIQPPENSPSKEVNSDNGRGMSEETIIEVGEDCPGSYFMINREQQDVKKAQKWIAKPSKVILHSKDEHPESRGRRRPVVKKTFSFINRLNNSGTIAVGGKRAIIKGAPFTHSTGDENPDQPSTSSIQPPENPSSKEINSENGRGISEETIIEVGENCPGSYYGITREQQDEKKAQKWHAKPSKVILYCKGDAKFKWSIEEFLENPVKFICDMDKNTCSLQEEKEDFILHAILPHLEESWRGCFSSNQKIYEILARISCSRKSAKVVRQALQLLLYLICKDNFDSCHENVLVVEVVLRSSILSSEGLFKTDRHSERELKLYAYSRILSSLVIQQVLKGELHFETLKQDLKKLQKELKQFGNQLKNKKKDGFRYSIEFIQEAIPCLLNPQDKLKVLLYECQEFCSDLRITSGDLKILQGLKKNGKWIGLHCILIYLHGKVYCERPVPQMETERRAMTLFRLLVETYLKRGGGDDWRFCLLAAWILSDIARNNATKEVRTEAGGCLVNLFKDTKVQRRPDCRAFLQQRCSEVLLCPDKEIRTILVHFLSKYQNLPNDLQVLKDLHIKHLTSMYRILTLEINQTIISQSSGCFVTHGMFQRKKVAVKVLFVKKQHLLEDSPFTNARERLIREADCLRMLNESRHPNIPVLLGYDTTSLPYHIITAFEKFGNLLQLVRRSREKSPRLQPVQLLSMLIDIAEALLYLEKLGLAHRAVMAANVLVGDNYVCKLSGMQSVQQLTSQTEDSDSLYSYCSLDDGLPEFISTTAEELPTRWQAPECLLEHRYSTASDVWAFGTLMYEVLTLGCLPYRHIEMDEDVSLHIKNKEVHVLPFEQCFEENEYELMLQCCELQRHRRLKLFEVKARLIAMQENPDEELPRPDPPSLDNHLTYESSSIGNAENGYSSVSDRSYEQYTYQSIENDQATAYEFNDDRLWSLNKEMEKDLENRDFPKRQMFQGVPVVRENITKVDVQHLKRLLALKNPNLVPVWKIHNLDSHSPTVEIISKEAHLGNLKEYVFNKRCGIGDIVTFLSQVASALHYLHENHIVHGDLSAEHVSVAAPDKVQVGRLGRSKPLYMSAYEVTSTSCVVEGAMPPDATRWSAPEVILDGHYTHASDVWAFGILAWELYASFTTEQDGRDLSVPFFNLEKHEILPHIRNHGPLSKPDGCPDWVYILMHQCWAYDSVQRPPALAIFDCLTSRKPMESWIMKSWLESHDENEWPDLSICQTEDACHVTDMKSHPSKEVIEKMCSDEFFTKHKYKYVDVPSVTIRDDEEDDYSCCPKVGNPEANECLDISSNYDITPNPVERDHKLIAIYQDPKEPDGNESGYLCPVAMEVKQRSNTGHHSSNQGTIEAFGSKRSHTEICQAGGVSRTPHEATYSQVTKIKKRVVEYSNAVFSFDQDDSTDENTESIPNYDTPRVAYENAVHILDQGHTCQDEGTGFIPKQEACPDEYEAMDDHSSVCFYQNAAFWTSTHPTGADHLVPQSDHLYANMQEKVDEVSGIRFLLGAKNGQPHMEARCQTAGVSERNPLAPSWLNNHKLEVTFYV